MPSDLENKGRNAFSKSVTNCPGASQIDSGLAPALTDALTRLCASLDAVALALARASSVLPAPPAGACAPPPPGPHPDAPGTLLELANACLRAKAAANVRPRYLRQLRSSLSILLDFLGEERAPHHVRPADVAAWLDSRPDWSPRTRLTYLTDARTLFAFAVRRQFLGDNPALRVEKPRLDPKPAKIHSPAEVRQVLRTARTLDPDLCRLLAVQYFAGVRPAEAALLSEADFGPVALRIEGHKSKTRRRRIVEITPTLRAWLDAGGTLPLRNLTKRWRAVREASGIAWPGDVTRHTFCTYAVATHGAKWTAAQAGHSEGVLFATYRELTTPEAAGEFWALRPARDT